MENRHQLNEFLDFKFGPRKLTKISGWSQKDRYSNSYILNDILANFLIGNLLTVEEIQPYITSNLIKELANHHDEKSFEIFKKVFNKKRDAEYLISCVCSLSPQVQDFLFDNYVTDKDIDNMKYQDDMWSSDTYTKNLKMLFKRGLISLENKNWARHIELSYMRGEEIDFLFSYYKDTKFGKNIYKNTFEKQCKHGLHAYQYFEELKNWNGFIGAITDEFLIHYYYDKKNTSARQDVFNALLFNKKIDKKDLEYLTHRYETALVNKADKEKKEKEDAILKAEAEYVSIVDVFKKCGVVVKKPTSEKWNSGDRYIFATDVDGYEHTMYIMKKSFMNDTPFLKQVQVEVSDHNEMLQKYAKTVHAEMDRIRSLGIECTHVMEGGGAQMQAFFCDSKGYICIMYLGMKGQKPCKEYTCHMQRREIFGVNDKDPFAKNTFYSGSVIEYVA